MIEIRPHSIGNRSNALHTDACLLKKRIDSADNRFGTYRRLEIVVQIFVSGDSFII